MLIATRKIAKAIFLIHYSMIVAVRFMNRRPATRKTAKAIFLIIIACAIRRRKKNGAPTSKYRSRLRRRAFIF